VLELGNFSGWIDESAIRSRTSGSTSGPAVTVPAPAANLQARALSSSQVSLTWSDVASNEQGYRIYRSLDEINFTECGTTTGNATSHLVASLAADTRYYFAVKSFNAVGESSEVLAICRTLQIAPPSPTGLGATVQTNAILLKWNPVSGALGYNVKRSPNPAGPFVTIRSNVTTTAVTDAPPLRGVVYYYTVSSRNSATESANCPTITASLVSATANVRLLGVNLNRKGNWLGSAGREGYVLAGDAQSLPTYATVSFSGKSDWTWEYNTADNRALQRPSGTSRLASCWYSPTTFEVDINLSDGQPHKVSLYTVDWDRAARQVRMDAIDAVTGRILHTSYFGTGTGGGVYLEYQLQGHVKIRYTRQAGPNTVVSGIFFDKAN
jgi:hypothetical protein